MASQNFRYLFGAYKEDLLGANGQYAGYFIDPSQATANNTKFGTWWDAAGISHTVTKSEFLQLPAYDTHADLLAGASSLHAALKQMFPSMSQEAFHSILFGAVSFDIRRVDPINPGESIIAFKGYFNDLFWTNAEELPNLQGVLWIGGHSTLSTVPYLTADSATKTMLVEDLNAAHNLNAIFLEDLHANEFPLIPEEWVLEVVTLNTIYGIQKYFLKLSKVVERAFAPGTFALAAFYYVPRSTLQEETPPPSSTKFGGTSMVTGEQALKNVQANHAAINVFNNNSGLGAYGFVQNQDYPIFQDNLSHYVPWATLKAFVAETLTLTWDQGSFALPDSGGQAQEMLPSQLTAIAGELSRVEANTQDFFSKQEHVWEAEARFFEFLINEIEDRCEETKITYSPITHTLPEGVTETSQTFGPFVVLTRDSESNKGYKYNNLAGWAYRSLIKTVSFDIIQKVIVDVTTYRAGHELDGAASVYTAHSGSQTLTEQQVSTAPPIPSKEAIAANPEPWFTWYSTLPDAEISGFTMEQVLAAPKFGEPWFAGSYGGVDIYFVTFYCVLFGNNYPAMSISVYPVFGQYHVSYLLEKQEAQVSPCVTTNLGFTEIIGHGRYDALGVFSQTDAIPEPYVIPDPCLVVPEKTNNVVLGSSLIGNPGSLLTITVTIDGQEFSYIPIAPLIFPPATILLRSGSIAPIYPTKEGAYVYDLFLKKWGKMKQQYKQLLDFSPVNNISSQVYPHDVFGIQAALLDSTGNIKVFDEQPIESEIWYGKLGLYRHGMTSFEEFIAQYKRPATGVIELQGSLDGKTIDPSLTQVSQFTDQVTSRSTFTAVGRWFIIKIKGIWDLCYAEFRAYRIGRR